MGPERRVEAYLVKQVKAAGGMCIKSPPTTFGVPDRMVILPPGVVYLVELKSKNGVLRPIQRVFHARARRSGLVIPVLSTKEEIDSWIRSVI